MERTSPEEAFIILGSAVFIVFVVAFAVIVVLYKRRILSQKQLIDRLQNEQRKEIDKLKRRVKELENNK